MALSAEAAMVLLREAMEGLLPHELVSATVFVALGEVGGEVPVSEEALGAFIDGPLRRALIQAADEATADSVRSHLRSILGGSFETTPPPPPATKPDAEGFAEDPVTQDLGAEGDAYVLVLAASDALERRLRLALGEGLDAGTATGVVSMHAKILGHSPRLVVVDATDPPDYGLTEIVRALGRNHEGSITAVWGSDEAYASSLADREMPSEPLGLSVSEGVGPLLDLCRSFGMPHGAPRVLDGSHRPTPRIGSIKRVTRSTPVS